MAEIERGTVIRSSSHGGTIEDAAGEEVRFRSTDAANVIVRGGKVVLERSISHLRVPKTGREIVFYRTAPGSAFTHLWAPAEDHDAFMQASIQPQEAKEEIDDG